MDGVNIVYELDHMLNGQGSRQHHQDIIRQIHYERFACEVEAAQQHQKLGINFSGITSRFLTALIDFKATILRRAARRDTTETLPVTR